MYSSVALSALLLGTTGGGAMAGRQPVPIMTGSTATHVVLEGESLVAIAARYGVEVETLAADNQLRAGARLRPGTTLRVDSRHLVPFVTGAAVVVNVPQRMLFVFAAGGVQAYPVAVGRRDWPTPLGLFVIEEKETDPTWDVPASIQREMAARGQRVLVTVPPGPDNPLGDRYIRLAGTGIGIHGTNQPSSIYRFTTHGCIRLHTDDARRVFDQVDVGMKVAVVYEPVLAAKDEDGQTWLEVQPDRYRRVPDMRALLDQRFANIGADPTLDARTLLSSTAARAHRPFQLRPGSR
jgi:L,D-transpeptidase ErfK/SrfK